jgi:sugar lactone lactonase YvrE
VTSNMKYRSLSFFAGCMLFAIVAQPSQAQSLSSPTSFGSVNVGSTSSVQTLTFTFGASETLGAVSVVTQGATGLDFANSGTGTCTAGTSYSSGNTCTVTVTFAPAQAGTRYGAAVLDDNSGNEIATDYLQGTGVGPQVTFLPGTENTITTGGISNPAAVAVDASGDVYIADTGNNRILKETLSAGSYTESVLPVASSLSGPSGVAVDGNGNIFIADTNNNRVLKETQSAGSYIETTMSTGSLNQPLSVAVDGAGNVYIADTNNNRILLESVTSSGYSEILVPTSAISYPSAVEVGGAGDIYVADSGNNRIVKETLSGSSYTESTVATSSLTNPSGLAIDGIGNIYIADTGNSRVLKEAISGASYSESVLTTSALSSPSGVAVDGSGDVYIADTYNSRILEEDFVDAPSLSFANTVPGSTSSDSPQTVTLENAGNASLTLAVPGSGTNPSISTNFSLNSGVTSACPLVSTGSSAGTLAAGASCLLPVSFTPTTAGTLSGSLALTDNALNASVTQTIALGGIGTGSTSQTISFSSIPSQSLVWPETVTLSAAASSGLPVSFASTTSTVCTASTVDSTATLLTTGTCTIQATQPGDPTYAPATPVSQSFTVTLIPQTITFSPIPNQAINTSAPVALMAAASSDLQVSFTSTTPTVCIASTATATVTLLTTGTCTIQASQPGDGVAYAAATPVSQSFTVESISPLTGTNFGSVNVGSTSGVQTLTFTFGASETLGAVSVVTQGATGLDFANSGSGTCTVGTAYSSGNTCTVTATFAPAQAGTRYGAAVLDDNSGNVIATDYLQGTGVGPQITFLPGTENTITTSSLDLPAGVAVDASGNLYIVDSWHRRVLKETLSGGSYTESTIASYGGSNSLIFPYAVTVDGSGNVYIAAVATDPTYQIILETFSGGTYTETTLPTSSLYQPNSVAVDGSGNVYIADTGNDRVLLEAFSSGTYTESQIPTSAQNPTAVAVDGTGDVYISNGYSVLREVLSAGRYVEETVPTSGGGGLAVDGVGNVYIANGNRVLKDTLSGVSYSESVLTTSALSSSSGVAVDGGGNVYVADTGNNRVLKEDLSDAPSLSFANTAPGSTSSDSPQTIMLENMGNASLTFAVPGSGTNPTISTNFSLNSSVSSACPLVSTGSSAGTLAAGASCLLPVSFTPTTAGTLSGSLALTDNALNASVTQTIALGGIGTGSTSQTISFDSIGAQSTGTSLTLSATASSGLTVNFASTTPTICTVSGTTAIFAAAGTCTIQATQPGDLTYAPATPVSQSSTVTFTLTSQTITFNAIPNQPINTSVPVTLTAWASSYLPVSFTSTTPTVCTASTATAIATLLTTGTCTIQASQPGDGVTYAAATPVSQSFTVESISPLTGTNFGSVNVGSTSSAQTLTFTFSASETLGAVSVVTQGATGLDFANSGTGTCTVGTSYSSGNTCTVTVTFAPAQAGTRYGAAVLDDNSGNVIATDYLQGTGVGPQITFLPGTENTITTSSLSNPAAVAVDASGDIYIADTGNNRILKETLSAGSYTESTIPTSTLSNPSGVAVDGAGNVYVADSGNNRILLEIVTGTGYTETTIPTSALSDPSGIVLDGSGNVYIADSGNDRVLMEALSGGTYAESTVPTSSLNQPNSVAVDGSGNVYIADTYDSRVLKETLSGGSYTETVLPTGSLDFALGVSVDDNNNVYVTESDAILRESFLGGSYSESVMTTSALFWPYGVAVDSRGNVYIADTYNNRVLEEDFADAPSLSFATTAPGSTSSDSPQMLTVQNVGNSGLTLPVPASGINPAISANFTLGSAGSALCPQVGTSSSAGVLFPGHACNFPISFTPTTDGSLTGTLAITDNALNSAGPSYTTQTVQLSGSGSDGMGGDALPYHPGTGSPFRPEPDLTLPCGHGDSVITDVTPSKWFAGKQYHVTVHGTNFLFGTGDGFCLSTLFVQVTNTKKPATVSDVRWVSSTEITATIELDAHEPTESLQLSIGCGDPCDFYPGMIYGPIQVLPTPQIQWKGNTISGDNPSPQDVIVGQKIQLSTSPTTLPTALTFSQYAWTAGGTNIGSRPLTLPSGNSSTASITTTILNQANLTTYWLYPKNDVSVTYHYCVNIPGLSDSDLASQGNCSADATAQFNVNGPSASIIQHEHLPYALGYPSVSLPIGGCNNTQYQYLTFGLVAPGAWGCDPDVLLPGIVFDQGSVSGVPAGGGSFFWLQLVDNNTISFSPSSGTTVLRNAGTGLDNTYPYSDDDNTLDYPQNSLLTTGYVAQGRAFSARMYLMWQSLKSDTTYIAVPIGYVQWGFNGVASYNASNTPQWSLNSTSSTTMPVYHQSTDIQNGMPTWTTLVTNVLAPTH